MKRLLLILLLAALVLLEFWFLESFLPYNWRHPISESWNYVFSSKPYPPHDMNFEIEMFLRDHLLWRIGIYLATALLAIANGTLIRKVWKALRKPPSPPPKIVTPTL